MPERGFFAEKYRESEMVKNRQDSVIGIAGISGKVPEIREKRRFANNGFRNAWILTCRNYQARITDMSFFSSRLLLPIGFAVLLMTVFIKLGYSGFNDNLSRISLLLMSSMTFALLSPVYIPECSLSSPRHAAASGLLGFLLTHILFSVHGETVLCSREAFGYIPNLFVLFLQIAA